MYIYHLALSFGSNDDDDNPEAVQRQRRELLKRNARARNIRAAILDFTACFDVDARAIERTHPKVHLKDGWTWISLGLADRIIQGVLWQNLWGSNKPRARFNENQQQEKNLYSTMSV